MQGNIRASIRAFAVDTYLQQYKIPQGYFQLYLFMANVSCIWILFSVQVELKNK